MTTYPKMTTTTVPFRPTEWLSLYEQAIKMIRQEGDAEMMRSLRIAIMQDTMRACREARYRLEDGTLVQMDRSALENASKQTKKYGNNHVYSITKPEKPFPKTHIKILAGDCLEAALSYENTIF